ncbi:uncharacterized protein PHALS_08115 [Plasmopara halstedii]|uniref:Uncharacterized protein n=1 Tax=Plasmopara halstedii TaxID=4781 RepID=A0A0N7L8N9_PLAHL|nr:uncharacterized protein PHALS_08115 [Plasmopara halstedii]CEG50403.1 hypothetical protein PHALS_08115 [Plasmopara halstedii]|eukprot:XP_024586772.1 hypothetical protein PHALS_08115 [Plasmopara halstedii]
MLLRVPEHEQLTSPSKRSSYVPWSGCKTCFKLALLLMPIESSCGAYIHAEL